MFADNGSIPNNPTLPMLVYSGVLSKPDASTCRSLFHKNRWGGTWVNGVYSFHHYHSTSHEVLGVVRGSADVQFGGEQGKVLTVVAGDVLVLPAGTGHCRRSSSTDFQVVGAYPPGQENWDLMRGDPSERPKALENIRSTALPQTDPVFGESGPLIDYWHKPG